MQNGKLILQEIIWEITSACHNNCDYCGSKGLPQVIDETKIVAIAKQIAKYAPKAIDISGGDPLLVSLDTHRELVGILKEKKVVCKIIINPKSVEKSLTWAQDNAPSTILMEYDWVGISVNDARELEIVNKDAFKGLTHYEDGIDLFSKSTIITNFNVANLFLFDKICSFVKQNNMTWQIQYTMYKETSNPMSVYENESASEFLFKKINDAMDEGVRIVVADNMTASPCSAGTSSLGILFDGSVVPCLSMRSWVKTESPWSQTTMNGEFLGRLIEIEKDFDSVGESEEYDGYAENPLKYIWEHRFHEQRFGTFKSCKDHCNNKCFARSNLVSKGAEDGMPPITGWKSIKNPPDRMILYGVMPELDKTFVYGVMKDTIVTVYAVTTYPCDFDNISSTTVTGDFSKINCQKPKNNDKKE